MSLHFERALDEWRECREDYEMSLYAQYVRAEAVTNGCLLNDRGKRCDIDALSLFMGNETRARAYASAELLEHWESTPRVTFADFEHHWMANRADEGRPP
jgi:hypothetical protein